MEEVMDRSFMDFYRLRDILRAMTVSRRLEPSAYNKFSTLLMSDKRDKVVDYTLKAVIASFAEDSRDLELVFDDIDSLILFFINLCRQYTWIVVNELTHSDQRRRYQMCLIFRSLFSLKAELTATDVCRELITNELNEIWINFLKLFTDSEPYIRIASIEITEVILRTQIDEHIVSRILFNLRKRLRDLETVIREQSAVVIENSSQSENILDRNLMRHFVARIGDTDLKVRERCQISVANVFNTIRSKYCKTHNYYFFKLSTACLLAYNYTELEEEKAWIEEIFVTNLIDQRADMPTKMMNLLQLICHCDPIAIRIISKIFHNQLITRTLFAKLMVSSKRHNFQTTIIFSNPNVAQSLKKYFDYIDDMEELLSDFHLLLKEYHEEDEENFRTLLDTFMSKTTISGEESETAVQDFFTREQTIVDKKTLEHMYSDLKARTGIGLIDVESLIVLLEHMDSFKAKWADRLASFVVVLSKCYTNYFTDQRVIDTLLSLPHIILTHIASDSVIECIKFDQSLKDSIIEIANEPRSSVREESPESDSSSSSGLSDFVDMQKSDPFQENPLYANAIIDSNHDNI